MTDRMMLTVVQMASDLGCAPDVVRNHCRLGHIDGAVNIGTSNGRQHWRAPLEGWEKFKQSIRAKESGEKNKVITAGRRGGRDLLGI